MHDDDLPNRSIEGFLENFQTIPIFSDKEIDFILKLIITYLETKKHDGKFSEVILNILANYERIEIIEVEEV